MAGSAHPGVLLLRAHAGPGVGAGHVMRCLALAQAWQDRGGTAHFRLGPEGASLEPRLRAEGMEVGLAAAEAASAEDAAGTGGTARRLGARAVVLDGYPFTGPFQKAVKAAWAGDSGAMAADPAGLGRGGTAAGSAGGRPREAMRLMAIDDNGECDPYEADVILNQNLHAREDRYRRRPPGSRLLLGGRYVLLRKEFLAAAAARKARAAGPIRNILVTLGGGDPGNVTLKAVRALQRIAFPGMRARVLVGALNPNLDALRAAVDEYPGSGIALVQDARDMPAQMSWADLALSAAGSTIWEMLYMGLPAVILATADNQSEIAASVHALGAAESLGWHADADAEAIAGALERRIAEAAARASATGPDDRRGEGAGHGRSSDTMADRLSEPLAGRPSDPLAGRAACPIDGLGAARVAAILAGEEPG